jgi:hypothetical protein
MIKIEEHEALAAFARLYGRPWRRELGKRWENGTLLLSQVGVSEDELASLAGLKGKLGPSGLKRYKPPVYAVEMRVVDAAHPDEVSRAERDDALGLRFHPGTPRHVRERVRGEAEARAEFFPWRPACAADERTPQHRTPGEALLRVQHLLTLGEPTWQRAEYRIVEVTNPSRHVGPTRCPCGRPIMLARTADGKGRIALEPAPGDVARGVFVFFMGAAIPDPLPANLPEGTSLYREHACSRPMEGGRW